MKFTSQIIAAASGSMGGTTFSRNRFGQYTRARAVPVNPQSAFQNVVRNALSQLVTSWTEVLTQAQRDAWDTYGQNVPVVDALGNSRNLAGQNWYIACNVPRIQSLLGIVNDAPTIFDRGTFDPPSITVDATDDEIDVAFDDANDWANETGGAMFVYVSRPVNASRNFFAGPYRFAGLIAGDDTTTPTSPATFDLPFPVAAGNKVGTFVRVARADGRLSSKFPIAALAT